MIIFFITLVTILQVIGKVKPYFGSLKELGD